MNHNDYIFMAGAMLVCAATNAAAAPGDSSKETFGSPGTSLAIESASLRFDYWQPEEETKDQVTSQTPEPQAHTGAGDGHSLATKLQNPVADLVSVPIQFNWDTGLGQNGDGDKITINIQPVIPFHLNENWNLISRTILPVIYEEGPSSGVSSDFGIGDTLQSLFFSPVEPIDGWILGFGPAIQLPTGTSNLFRSEQWALGPTGVALRQQEAGKGTLTYGMLANHLWRIAGADDFPDVNNTFIQPFLSYTTAGGSTFTINSESSYNWTSSDWTVPFNFMFAQLVHFGEQPVQLQFGARYYATAPDDGPEWGFRFAITFLFPQG